MSSYESLGQLMTEMIQAYRGSDPATLADHVRRGDLGTWLLQRAKAAQQSLYGMFSGMEYPKKNGYLANHWSDLKYETAFPNYTRAGTAEDRQLARKINRVGVVDEALRAANLGYGWNPDNQVSWTEENRDE